MGRKRVTSSIITLAIAIFCLFTTTATADAAQGEQTEEKTGEEKRIRRFEFRPMGSVSLMKDKELEKNPAVSYEIPEEWQEAKPKQRRKFARGAGTGIAIGAISGTGGLIALCGAVLAPGEEAPLVAGGIVALAGAVVGIVTLVTKKDENNTQLAPIFDGKTAGLKGSVKF